MMSIVRTLLIISALLLATSSFSETPIDLHSKLWQVQHTTKEQRIELISSFISTGAFNSPYTNAVLLNQNDIDSMRKCLDSELWIAYSRIGSDTEVGIVLIDCAYQLGWINGNHY